ncbi:MAG TPA: outer membrane beta-barrel protein, partial [Chryseolinea sp.]|nr:outer membrane beta-barrel protein [Chryseolinea sp.]
MKTRNWFIFLFVMLGSPAFSQILVGPVVGGNYSFASLYDDDAKSTYKVGGVYGYHVGGHLAFKVRKRFFLHASLIYSTKGRTMSTDHDVNFAYKSQYNFIDLPISYTVDFKAKLGNSKEFKYFVGLGPNVSYWLNGKGTLSDTDLKENNIEQLSYTIAFQEMPGDAEHDKMYAADANRFQLGLNFVAGMVFEPAKRQRVMITARY